MRLGIIGAGQLGRMLALAAYPLGIQCTFLGRSRQSPGGLVGQMLVGGLDDGEQLDALAERSDVVTFEFENIPAGALERAGAKVPVYPPVGALAAAQDRLQEKRLFESVGIPTAPYVAVDDLDDLRTVEAELDWPVVLKARRLGYDGRSQRVADSRKTLEEAWSDLNRVPAIAESWVRYERELSLIGARGADGETVYYPLAENVHDKGILSTTIAPYRDDALHERARLWLATIMDKLEYRGVLAVEFFHTTNGLIANEMAPRVHNSGHWTIEGAETSQFENHVRAVLGLPLGSPAPRGCVAMLNLIGRMPDAREMLRIPGVHLHDYCKEPRPNRKLGHCTLIDADHDGIVARLAHLSAIVNRVTIP